MMRAMRIPVPADGGSKPMRSEYGRNATAFTAIAGLGLVVACPAVAQEADGRELLIENVTILSAERERPQEHRHVLIRDGRIVEVRAESIQANANVHRLDGSGKYLTPGLMDSHVHVSDVPGLPPQAVFSSAGRTRSSRRCGMRTFVSSRGVISISELLSCWTRAAFRPGSKHSRHNRRIRTCSGAAPLPCWTAIRACSWTSAFDIH